MQGIVLTNETGEELWATYSWWACILVLKMMTLTWFTGRIRVHRQVIHSEEDRMWMKSTDVILCPTGGGHPDVDRIRAVHRHDLEIILPYLCIMPISFHVSSEFLLARMIIPCFALTNILYTLFSMSIIKVRNVFKTILMVLEYLIVGYISVMCMIQ